MLHTPLPIDAVLPRIRESLNHTPRLIVEAAPGAGKTSRVPLAIHASAWLDARRIIMLEPRRLAARAAARHMAQLMGEEPGHTVGYRTAVDGKESKATRILVVTEGILTRMLQADPTLEDVGCVIFDEFHERNLQADVGLALCLDSQESLRPDLRLVIMSATLEGERLRKMLGDCPLVKAEGRSFPVEVRYVAGRAGTGCEEQTAQVVRQALAGEHGSILVFLPGAAEIRRTEALLRPGVTPDTRMYPLYGDLSPEEQDAAIAPAPPGERKIVLATNIAESSLTIEGIRVVVDSGLARTPRFEPAWGMSRLITERISRASAEQRRGRAGRLEPGLCVRLWPEHEQAALRPAIRPEMLEADLASLCLEIAAWGLPAGHFPGNLHWLDVPTPSAWEEARALLSSLGALDAANRITTRGLAMSALPLHPRLAHMVLEGKARNQGMHACALAALFSERDPGVSGADVTPRLALLLEGTERGGATRRLRERMRRIARRAGINPEKSGQEEQDSGPLLALAWPERVALRRGPGVYVMANGRGAAVRPDDPLAAHECLAVAVLQGNDRQADARIHLAAPLTRERLETMFVDSIVQEDRLTWDAERKAVKARSVRCLGALVLEERPALNVDSEAVKHVLLQGIRDMGLAGLPWTEELFQWRRRVDFVRLLAEQGLLSATDNAVSWPDCGDAFLLDRLEDWLGPCVDGVDRLSKISSDMLEQALHTLLPWEARRRLEALAPEWVEVPSGSRIRLDYAAVGADAPVLAVKLQEMFGLDSTPAVAEGRVPLLVRLLSPAGRPVQVTRDLAGFWKEGYHAVRADLRGRYPKHPWPEDPCTAVPTGRTKKAMDRHG